MRNLVSSMPKTFSRNLELVTIDADLIAVADIPVLTEYSVTRVVGT